MNLTTNEVPRTQWPAFVEDLSRHCDGWAITIELLGRDIGDQFAAENLAMQGASFDPAGSDAGDLLFDIGDMANIAMVHRIHHPTRIFVAELQPGAETDLQIIGADGTTIVHLRRRPELPPHS